MSQHRDLAWRVNWYRQSELDGALLLGRIVRQADDPYLIQMTTRHAADEAVHSALWADAIGRAGLPLIRIFRSYQSFYSEHGVAPTNVDEVLAITHVFEHRVDKRFNEELENKDLPASIRETFQRLIADEQQHLDWIGKWLANRPGCESLLEQFRKVDQLVYDNLQQYVGRTWDIPGLGEEIETTDFNPKELTNASN